MNGTAQHGRFVGVHLGLVALVMLVLLPGTASAQAVGGTVADTTAGVLPGVTVEARSPVLIEQVRTAVTDSAGQYLITALESGVYSVTFTLPGFRTLMREGVELSSGFTANIDAQLTVGALEETITVTIATPAVDVQSVTQQTSMDREIIDTIPSGKSFQNLGVLIPGMVYNAGNTGMGSDIGGQGGQTQFRLGIHGGATSDQHLDIDGMGIETGQNGGSDSMAWLAEGNFSEIVMDYSANSAEVETGGVRVNLIPREGGNEFSGSFSTSFSDPSLQAENIDQDLIDRGFAENSQNRIQKMWRFTPSFGGPIMQNKLWFHISHTTNRVDSFVANLFPDTDKNDLDYTPITDNPDDGTIDDQLMRSQALRLTWQATPRNKFTAYWENTSQDRDHFLAGFLGGLVTEEASIDRRIRTNVYQATWTMPVTSRVLLEAGFGIYNHASRSRSAAGVDTSLPPALLIASSGGTKFVRGFASWFPRNAGSQNDQIGSETYRFSMSYVTGSHALKVGVNYQNRELNFAPLRDVNVRYRAPGFFANAFLASFLNHGAEFFSNSELIEKDVSPLGVYVQDQWTLDRLTINAGLRLDYFEGGWPDGEIETSQYRAVAFPFQGDSPYGFKDLQPRLGVAYDLFGTGKTALKVTANRYADQLTNDILDGLTPADSPVMARAWRDLNGDGVIQGDPLIVAANGEFVRNDGNPAFGQPVVTVAVDPDYGTGWGQRTANWEYSAGVQHELRDNVSVNFAYFYRTFTNFGVTDDANLSASDYDTFSVVVPLDSRLPGGGGNTISGLRDIKPGSLGRAPNDLRTSAQPFGDRTQTWKGFDLTTNARLEDLLLQGGISSGTTSLDSCDLQAAVPDNFGRGEFCKSSTDWLTRASFLASYTLPYGIQVAATFQSQTGPQRSADVSLPQSSTDLGRPLSQNLEINVIDPGTEYGERANLFDLRFTKIINAGQTQIRASFDIYNAFNNNSATGEVNDFTIGGNDDYLTPTAIIPGRLAKFSVLLDF